MRIIFGTFKFLHYNIIINSHRIRFFRYYEISKLKVRSRAVETTSLFPATRGICYRVKQTCLCFRENITAGFKATNEFAPDAIIALLYFRHCCTRCCRSLKSDERCLLSTIARISLLAKSLLKLLFLNCYISYLFIYLDKLFDYF